MLVQQVSPGRLIGNGASLRRKNDEGSNPASGSPLGQRNFCPSRTLVNAVMIVFQRILVTRLGALKLS